MEPKCQERTEDELLTDHPFPPSKPPDSEQSGEIVTSSGADGMDCTQVCVQLPDPVCDKPCAKNGSDINSEVVLKDKIVLEVSTTEMNGTGEGEHSRSSQQELKTSTMGSLPDKDSEVSVIAHLVADNTESVGDTRQDCDNTLSTEGKDKECNKESEESGKATRNCQATTNIPSSQSTDKVTEQPVGSIEDMSEEFSSDHPYDVHVAIINGPVGMSDSRSDDLGVDSHTLDTNGAALVEDVENLNPDADQSNGSIHTFEDDDDIDPELLDINHFPSQEQEIRPIYEVGPYVTAECEICLEHNLLYLRLCCGTPICDQCMTTYLESVIKTGKVKIECAGLCQQKYIHRDEIIARISFEMKEKYCKFLVDANNEPHIKTCPRCSHVLQVELTDIRNPRVKKKGLQVTCPECLLEWCFPCQAPWHEGITCKDHRKGNKLLRKWAKSKYLGQHNAQRCPKCKVYIQRISGCDHMVCSKCDTSFCYRCGERYLHLKCIGDHYSRFSIFGCKYIYKAEYPLQRKLIRGSIFGAKLVAAPVVGVLAVGVGSVLLSGALLFFLPCYGIKKFHNHRKLERARKAAAEDKQRWRRKLEEIHGTGDPYLTEYNRLHVLGVSPIKLVNNSKIHQQIRGLSFITDEQYALYANQSYQRFNAQAFIL